MDGQCHVPTALPQEKTWYRRLYRKLGGLQSRPRRVRKISLPPGFDPRTVQPVASRYTDWAIPVHRRSLVYTVQEMQDYDIFEHSGDIKMMIFWNNITAVLNSVFLHAADINLMGENMNTKEGKKFSKKKNLL